MTRFFSAYRKLSGYVSQWRAVAQRMPWALAIILTSCAVLLTTSPLGGYLNSRLFFDPMIKLRAKLALQPQLGDEFRLILLEDHSLNRLGDHPKYSDWQAIGDLLLRFGFEKVIMLDVFNLTAALGTTGDQADGHGWIHGAVAVTPGQQNLRAVTVAELPKRLFLDGVGADGGRMIRRQSHLMRDKLLVPDASLIPVVAKLGHLNISDDHKAVAHYRLGAESVLPHIGLLANDQLALHQGRLATPHGVIPTSADGTFYVDYVALNSVLERSLPVAVFFRDGAVMTELSPRLLERMAGAKVAVLVPAAYTGSRFIASPLGLMPSYLALVSVMQSSLTHRFLYEPAPAWLSMLGFIVTMWSVLVITRARRALALGFGLIFLGVSFAVAAFILRGWVFHLIPAVVAGISGIGLRAGYHFVSEMRIKMSLAKDLELGQAVQNLLLPSYRSGQLGAWRYKVVYKPHSAMSGDWFQIYEHQSDDGNPFSVIAIGDVVGKGAAAALNTAVITAIWRLFTQKWGSEGGLDIPALVATLDQTVQQSFAGNQNSTLSLAVVTADKVYTLSCAAPRWMVIRAAGNKVDTVKALPMNPIGMDCLDGGRRKVELQLVEAQQQDVLMTFTDGVMDGVRAISEFRRSFSQQPLDMASSDVLDHLEQRAVAFGKEDVLPDDFTLLFIQRVPDEDVIGLTNTPGSVISNRAG